MRGWFHRVTPNRTEEKTSTGQYVTAAPGADDHAGEVRDGDSVPPVLIKLAGWAWRFLVVCGAFYVLLHVISIFSTIVISLLVAFLLTALVEPPNRWMKRHGIPGALSALITILGFIGFVGGLLGLAGASIISGFSDLKERLVEGFEQIQVWLAEGPLNIAQADLDRYVQQIREAVSSNSSVIAGGVLNVTASVASIFTGLLLALFCMFFFLKDGRKNWHFFVLLLPAEKRYVVNESGIRAWKTLGMYTRTQVQVALIDAIGIAAVAYFLGVSLWLPIGVLVFVSSFVPIVGAFLSGTIACLVALVELGPTEALIMLVGVIAVQQIEGNILQPFLQGTQLSLHPVVVVLGVTAGAALTGIIGALFSVPLIAMINVVINYVNGRDMYPELKYDEDRIGGPPGKIENVFAKKNAQLARREKDAASKVGIERPALDEAAHRAEQEKQIDIDPKDRGSLAPTPAAESEPEASEDADN